MGDHVRQVHNCASVCYKFILILFCVQSFFLGTTSQRRDHEENDYRDRVQTTTRRPPPTTAEVSNSISDQKCKEYSKHVTASVIVTHLSLDADPIIIESPKCDFSSLDLIVGGTSTSPGEFPHMAAVGYRSNGKIDWDCGGSLISDFFVMTAAHCTSSSKGEPYMVRLGEFNLNHDDDGAQPINYRIAQIVKHPDYKPPARYNDIALLRTVSQVEFNTFIRPACLYTQNFFTVNKTVATGWGRIEYAEDPSETLLKVAINIIDSKTCNHLYRADAQTDRLREGIVSTMMCAGDLNGGKDTCQGDSGGPIQITDQQNHCLFYVIGVTSFGKFCAAENSPGVYTRVSAYIPWIESEVWPSRGELTLSVPKSKMYSVLGRSN